jgi:hypothetical protein
MRKNPRRNQATVRTTFDLEAALHKRLRRAAFNESVHTGEPIHMVDVVEQALRNLLNTLDNPDHDAAYDAAYEAGRRAAFAQAQAAIQSLTEDAPEPVAVAPVQPAPVRSLPTRPPTIATKGQS